MKETRQLALRRMRIFAKKYLEFHWGILLDLDEAVECSIQTTRPQLHRCRPSKTRKWLAGYLAYCRKIWRSRWGVGIGRLIGVKRITQACMTSNVAMGEKSR